MKKRLQSVNEKIVISIAAISLAYFLLVTGFYLVYYDQDFYEKQFSVNGAAERLGEENASHIQQDILLYLNTDKYDFGYGNHLQEFTELEKSHLADVKLIINILCDLYYLALLLFGLSVLWFILRRQKKLKEIFGKTLLWGGSLSGGLIVLLGLSVFINFDSLFLFFHKLLFPQGNFAFPVDSLLKTLFPDAFFVVFAEKMFLFILVFSIISIVGGLILKKTQ